MSVPLVAFHGSEIYVDAVCLIGYSDRGSPWHSASRRLFLQANDLVAPIRLVTAALTVDEVLFVLLEESVKLPPFNVSRSRGQYLRAHPDVVRQLMGVLEAPVRDMISQIEVEPVTPDDIAAMRQEMLAHGLLPRDAIHVSVMRRLGIIAIASDDDDFERCPGITLYKP